jgi:hypothetical protein
MSFDAFCYSKVDKALLVGETQDAGMKENNAFEILSFELGAENTVPVRQPSRNSRSPRRLIPPRLTFSARW